MRAWMIAAALVATAPAAAAQSAAPPPPPAVAPAYVSALCVWRALPDITRAQLLAAGPGVNDLAQALKTDAAAALQTAGDGCHVPAAGAAHDDELQAFTFVVVEAWASARLHSGFGVDEAALRQAWARVSADTRAKVLAADLEPTPDDAIATLADFTAGLHVTDPAAKLLVAIYASVRLHLAPLGETG